MQFLNKNVASVGNYNLVKLLGSGYNSKVKLGIHTQTGEYVAVKLVKHSHEKFSPKVMEKEISVLKEIEHPNMINLREFHKEIMYVKKNGQSYKVAAIIMDYVPNGEIFEYIVKAKRFPEPIARAFFHNLIETLEYCHNEGLCHRDLKPENLLFDAKFILKVADFGFATAICGKKKDGTLDSYLGTEFYMAPEIHLRQSYSGTSVDLFAAGIILFIMVAGNPPFANAHPKNEHYKLLCANRGDTFWAAHEKNKTKPFGQSQFFSNEFRDLINNMLALDPSLRLSVSEIKAHPWYNGPVADQEKIWKEFSEYKRLIDLDLEKQRKEKAAQKEKDKLKPEGNMSFVPNAMKGLKPHRDIDLAKMLDGNTKLLEQVKLDAKREVKQYIDEKGFKPATNAWCVYNYELIFKWLAEVSSAVFNEFEFSESSFKVSGKKNLDEGRVCKLNIEIYKVDDETSFIEFKKVSGDVMSFYEVVEEIKAKLPVPESKSETSE